jgi:hypothetical protein
MRVLPFVFFLVCLVGCDHSTSAPSTPTAPTPLPPTPTSPPGSAAVAFIRIDATSIGLGTQAGLTVGRTHQLVARGSLVGGGQIDVSPVWTVDNRNVLSIDSQGRISGVSDGWATVFATYSGMTATLAVRVASDFGGTWTGTWRLVRCDAPESSYCNQRVPPGSSRPFQLTIIMDRIFVVPRLSWDLDGVPVYVAPSSTVGENGTLSFGDRFFDARGFEVPLVAVSWRGQLVGSDRLNARMTLMHGLTDGARSEWEVTNATRAPTASTAPPSAPPLLPSPAAAVIGLAITQLPSTMVVGTNLQLQAVARFSDGSVQTVQPEWLSQGGIVEISPAGLLAARGQGSATIIARHQGFETRAGIFVVPDYSGTWRGGWRRLECFGPRCRDGDFAHPTVDLLISQHDSLGSQLLTSVMSFGPWNETRYVLSGRANVGITGSPSLFFFWLERGPQGERLREISLQGNNVTIDAAETLSARASMMLREGEEMTRLEFMLEHLRLVSRAVRVR